MSNQRRSTYQRREPVQTSRATSHRHLFQDLYDWAGDVRTVEIAKDGTQFMPRHFIETGMADVYSRLAKAGYLQGLTPRAFAEKAGEIIGDVNAFPWHRICRRHQRPRCTRFPGSVALVPKVAAKVKAIAALPHPL